MNQPHDPNQGWPAPPYPPQQAPYPQQPPYPPQAQPPYPPQAPYPPQQPPYPPQAQAPYPPPPYPPQAPYPPPPYMPPGAWPHQHAGMPTHGRPQYEFTAEQNTTVATVARWAKALAILMFVQAAFALFSGNWLGAAIDMCLGLPLWGGGTSLTNVVVTQGNDIGHLMQALDKLSTVFAIRVGFGIVLIVIAAIGASIALAIGLA